ncbi:TDT family transporter [Thermococcus gorgonarius]|uniref:C4-dicarboxylate ABC transporter n=1 Tax=Thermococcus gorgonarius TaxID=71997 RepID=A0A2Z2MA77_THEGO|nr:tellurite-resistance/dicarboxylate transporter [Thermococcus gorgonarius]ASJ00804.1 C4-dicarboxylate ABC transporter [Thermococcus gorgonarius]
MKVSVKDFAPSWFASVMGTGALALVSLAYSERLAVLKNVAVWLTYFNTALFFVLLIPWSLRWLKYRENATKDLYHPMVSHFYGTIAIAMLVLSADYLLILRETAVAKAFWLIGTPLTIFFALLIPYLMFIQEKIDIKSVTPAWFIPPVGLIVIPLSGGPLIGTFHGIWKEIAILINYFAWGSGFFLYLALFAVVMHRFITHEPLPCGIAPAIWINLGPIGAGTSTLYMLVRNSDFITAKEPFLAFGIVFWGFGVWWLAMAVIMTLHYIRRLSLPYSLAWWAFIFPLGAYVSATHNVGTTFGIGVIDSFGFALYWLLLTLWLLTGVKTLKHTLLG